jgi:penicillin V acylase-like amidase (Ntn superfamily)
MRHEKKPDRCATGPRNMALSRIAGALNPGGPINGVLDGLNEEGLAVNLLYLGETDFGSAPTDKYYTAGM